MTHRQIAEQLLDIGALLIRDREHLFTWASGIRSPIYCDNRLTLSFPAVRDEIASAFVQKVEAYAEVDVIVGDVSSVIEIYSRGFITTSPTRKS